MKLICLSKIGNTVWGIGDYSIEEKEELRRAVFRDQNIIVDIIKRIHHQYPNLASIVDAEDYT